MDLLLFTIVIAGVLAIGWGVSELRGGRTSRMLLGSFSCVAIACGAYQIASMKISVQCLIETDAVVSDMRAAMRKMDDLLSRGDTQKAIRAVHQYNQPLATNNSAHLLAGSVLVKDLK